MSKDQQPQSVPDPKVRIEIKKRAGAVSSNPAEWYDVRAYIDDDEIYPVHFQISVNKFVSEEARMDEAKKIFARITRSIATKAAGWL